VTPTVELRNVSKSFGRTRALNEVDLSIYPGEIVALLGDNGAGKSTLVRVIAGSHTPDSGELYVRGERRRRWSPRIAREAGIETVYQNKALAERQTIATNIFMGRELTNRLGFLHTRRQHDAANRVMRDIGFTSRQFDAGSAVRQLSGGERARLALALISRSGPNLHFVSGNCIQQTGEVIGLVFKIIILFLGDDFPEFNGDPSPLAICPLEGKGRRLSCAHDELFARAGGGGFGH